MLLLSDHKPLAEADRQWALKFGEALIRVEAGDPPQVVRDDVDQTIRKLTTALRERARG